jgi:hypothetical protein
LGEEYEEDLLSDDNGEGNSDEDSEDEDEGHDSESDDEAHGNAFDDDGIGNGNVPPILEDDLMNEDKGNGNQDENGSAALEEPNLDATGADSEDLVTLNVRLERMQALKAKGKEKDTSTSSEPEPLEIVPREPTVMPKSHAQIMKEKLRLPPHGNFTSLTPIFLCPIIHVILFIA